jgi:hypothetical protein
MQSATRLATQKFRSRSHDAVIRVYDEAGDVIATHEHTAISKSGEVFTGITSHFPIRSSMIPLSSGDCEGRERIRRNNSVKYYGKIPSISR